LMQRWHRPTLEVLDQHGAVHRGELVVVDDGRHGLDLSSPGRAKAPVPNQNDPTRGSHICGGGWIAFGEDGSGTDQEGLYYAVIAQSRGEARDVLVVLVWSFVQRVEGDGRDGQSLRFREAALLEDRCRRLGRARGSVRLERGWDEGLLRRELSQAEAFTHQASPLRAALSLCECRGSPDALRPNTSRPRCRKSARASRATRLLA